MMRTIRNGLLTLALTILICLPAAALAAGGTITGASTHADIKAIFDNKVEVYGEAFPCTIVLLDDIVVDAGNTIRFEKGNFVLDINSHDITMHSPISGNPGVRALISMKNDVNVTIKNSGRHLGKIESEFATAVALFGNNSRLTVYEAHIVGGSHNGTGYAAIQVGGNSHLSVYGGFFFGGKNSNGNAVYALTAYNYEGVNGRIAINTNKRTFIYGLLNNSTLSDAASYITVKNDLLWRTSNPTDNNWRTLPVAYSSFTNSPYVDVKKTFTLPIYIRPAYENTGHNKIIGIASDAQFPNNISVGFRVQCDSLDKFTPGYPPNVGDKRYVPIYYQVDPGDDFPVHPGPIEFTPGDYTGTVNLSLLAPGNHSLYVRLARQTYSEIVTKTRAIEYAWVDEDTEEIYVDFVVYEAPPPTPTPIPSPPPPTPPATGDKAPLILWIALTVISAIALTAIASVRKRRQ